VHLLARVDAVVSRQVSLLREALVTDGASVRPLARVRPAVDRQQRLVLKALAALRTRVLAATTPRHSTVHVAALSAARPSFLVVSRAVPLQPALRHKPLPARRALVRFLGAVRPLVNDEAASLRKPLVARWACVRSRPRSLCCVLRDIVVSFRRQMCIVCFWKCTKRHKQPSYLPLSGFLVCSQKGLMDCNTNMIYYTHSMAFFVKEKGQPG